MAADKPMTPAYGSFKTFTTFFNSRRDDEHATDVVDRSLMTNFSGSSQNELIAGLKFLKLIDEKGAPLPAYEQYVRATDAERKSLLAQLLRNAYPFVFNAPPFNIERATTHTTAEVFRGQGINGSTLSRAVAFFLAAAKEAGIKVGANIKAPPIAKASKPKKETKPNGAASEDDEHEGEDELAAGTQVFEIPIPINRKVKIMIPDIWSSADWDLFQTMLTAYIHGWKQMADKKQKEDEL